VIEMTYENEKAEVSIVNLEPRMHNIDVAFKVIGISEVREVTSCRSGESHTVADATVGDYTGIVTMPLWEDMIEEIESGKIYDLKNGKTGLFRGHLRLKFARESEIRESDNEIDAINYEIDKSEREYKRRRPRYGGYDPKYSSYNRSRGYGSSYNRRDSRRSHRDRRRRY
jgi:ssDNA-binding replication factor A large subunit